MTPKTDHTILVVEDSPEDFEATRRALLKSGLRNGIRHCKNGEEALDYLHRRGPYQDPQSAPRPSMILLDLNMPGTDGRDVLTEIKSDASLKTIPVVILTTSTEERDVEACYAAGANSFVQKPVALDGLVPGCFGEALICIVQFFQNLLRGNIRLDSGRQIYCSAEDLWPFQIQGLGQTWQATAQWGNVAGILIAQGSIEPGNSQKCCPLFFRIGVERCFQVFGQQENRLKQGFLPLKV